MAHESEPVIAVPAEALQQMNGDSVVFVAVNDATFELRRVELGDAADDNWLPVRSGLNEGERVVTEGSFLVKSELLRSSFEEE